MGAKTIVISLLLLLISNVISLNGEQSNKLGKNYYVSSTAKLIRSRGYMAMDNYVDVQNGSSTLNLVRATNPRINGGRSGLPGKEPILFVHGIFVGANSFILNTAGVEPRDYSGYNVASMGLDELQELLEGDPDSKSLVFTALNFGHEVWLLNRRPTLQAQLATFHRNEPQETLEPLIDPFNIWRQGEQEIDLDSMNQTEATQSLAKLGSLHYFDFSLDEQALYDIPEIIDYVLERTGRRTLAYVGHSAGSALCLMSLVVRPDITDKISKAVLWAPALYLKGDLEFFLEQFLDLVVPILARISLPIIPAFLLKPIEAFVGFLCRPELTQLTICDPVSDFIFGRGDDQQMLQNYNLKTRFLEATGTHEAAQLIQAQIKSKMHFFDSYDRAENIAAYGQPEPPLYDISIITSNAISIWNGNADIVVPAEDVDRIINDLRVPVDHHFIGGNGVLFNHNAFYTHNKIDSLLVIPSLKTIGN